MRFPFALAVAPIALLAACEQVATQPVEYRPEEAGTVDHALCLLGFTGVAMREVTTGHQLVDVSLNGREATFVVDTGANVSVLHAQHAEAFGIAADGAAPGGAFGVGGQTRASQARIESLSIGSIPIRQARIVLTDIRNLTSLLGPMSGGAVHGIIGQDVLAEHRAVIDVPRSILYLIPADEDPAPVAADRCRAEPEEESEANETEGNETS